MNLFSYIKQRLSITDVVGEYVSLKKAGHYWKACCPFHHERTPSFTVSPHKEIFYCFGCHTGGDVISFIAKIEHCSPIEAARHLTERHNIQLPQEVTWEKSSETREEKELYYQTCAVFARWCADQLQKNKAAQEYLKSRSISEASSAEFSLGYCPVQIKPLLAYAQEQGILAANFVDAHILMVGKTGLYSAFEERIIFPIRDQIGRFVGFGGRVFKEGDDRVKYYNSHEHAHFNKGATLFGLDLAKKSIASTESAFLVEGYTDLISMYQHGFTNTVATLGTACTLDQMKLLARYAQKVYILYDGDAAGQNAMVRLAELCWGAALDPFVIALPATEDPASFLNGGGNLTAKKEEALDIFSFILSHLGTDFSKKTLQERLDITQKIIGIILTLQDPLKRELLLNQASEVFALPVLTLKQATAARIRKENVQARYREQEAPPESISSGAQNNTIRKKTFFCYTFL